MERAEKVKSEIESMIESGEKPSATKIAKNLNYPAQDVHRCINYLERNKKVKSYTKKVVGDKYRFVSVYRE